MTTDIPAGYKLTEVGGIPGDWSVQPLMQLAEIRGGIAKNAGATLSDPVSVHYLRVANVQDGYLNLSDMSKIQMSRQDIPRYTVLPGDVLMNEGGDLDKLARGAIWRGGLSPCVHQNHVFVVRCKTNLLPEYLNIWTATSAARRFFLLAGKQTTNLASISKSSLGGLPVAFPPLPEQRAIATALSDVDALLAKLDALIAKKRDLKQATMQQLLTGQTRLPGFGGTWAVKRVEEFGEVVAGGTPRTDIKEYWGDGYPWITPTDISIGRDMCTSERYITRLGLNSIRQLPKNTVLVTCIASIGKNAILKPEGGCNQQINAVIPNKGHCAEFLYYLFEAGKQYLLANSGTTATSIISKATFSKLFFSVPSLPEQAAIATVLSDMDTELAALQTRRDKTHALKQGMMQALLTGRIRLV